MKQNSKNNLEVETIGVPIIDALSTEDKKAFAKALLRNPRPEIFSSKFPLTFLIE